MSLVADRVYALLRCPACDSSPKPESSNCPGCGHQLRMSSGNLDLLKDGVREEADRFAESYQALRRLEGWADENGREDPETGSSHLWKQRLKPVIEAASVLGSLGSPGSHPLIIDVGSGGGWAARYLPGADVVALDLVAHPCAATICARADMRDLPLRSEVADGMLFAASLHYAPVRDVVPEINRVLRHNGFVVAVDSPIYGSRRARDEARSRSRSYFAARGFPALIDHYHPIDAHELRRTLIDHGFSIRRFDLGARNRILATLRPRSPETIVVAEKL